MIRERIGDVVSRIPPEDLVLDAFRQELTRAGYTVNQVEALPPGVAKGLDITSIKLDLEEVASMVKSEGTARLAVSVVVWQRGATVKKLDYQANFSDIAVKDRAQLLPDALQNALQGVMEQSVPEIVKVLEQRRERRRNPFLRVGHGDYRLTEKAIGLAGIEVATGIATDGIGGAKTSTR